MYKRLILLFTVIVVSLYIQCATSYVTGERQFMLVSEREEINIGMKYAPQAVFEFGGTYSDDLLNNYINDVGQKLAKVSHRPILDYQFKVVNTSIVNAFALPGGYVYITRGMLDVLHNEAELAGVLGHEIAHISARHGASQMSKAMGFQIVLYAGLTIDQMYHQGRNADQIRDLVALGSSIIFNMITLGYGRNYEHQADELGVKYMTSSGYDPDGMIGVMGVLEDIGGKEPGKIGMLFSSHPKTSERMIKVKELSLSLKNSPEYEKNKWELNEDRFTKNVKDLKETQLAYNHYDKAVEYFSGEKMVSAVLELNDALKIKNNQAPFYNLMGDVYYKEKNYPTAVEQYNKSIQYDSSYVYAYYGIANCEREMRNYGNAEMYYKKAIKLYPMYSSAHFGLGIVYYNTNRWQEAADYLENSTIFDDNIPSSHALLGLTYEKLGRNNEAEIEFKKEVFLGVQGEYLNISKERIEYYTKLKSLKK
jgi:predicted Zn-dependent protease